MGAAPPAAAGEGLDHLQENDVGSPPAASPEPAADAAVPTLPDPAALPLQPNNAFDQPLSGQAPESPPTGRKVWLARLPWRLKSHNAKTDSDVSPVAAAETSGPADVPEVEKEGISNARDFNPAPLEAPATALSSADILVEIGHQLRARREMLSLTYEEIERHTHVRVPFLAALERGALDDLPSPVQTRGILANYAAFLDLDADRILLRYADALQARYRERGPQNPVRTRAPMTVNTSLPPLRSFIASDLVFGGGIAIMLLLFAIWGINRVLAVRAENAPRSGAPSISDVLAGTALPTLVEQVTVIPAQASPSLSAAQAPATLEFATLNPNVKVQVDLTASGRTYMRVTVDGKVQFEGRTDVSGSYSYQASNQLEILVGNAAAVRVNYNGRDLGLMGNFGEVVDRLYTAAGVATPTSTPAPTRTPTPNITATPSTTPTITPSVTKTPKPGG